MSRPLPARRPPADTFLALAPRFFFAAGNIDNAAPSTYLFTRPFRMTLALRKHILLVDDDLAGAELTLAALLSVDPELEVTVVGDGEEALDYLLCRGAHETRVPAAPAVILLDLKMPKVDGHEVLRHIRSDDSLRNLKVVILTSSDQARDRELSRALGSDGYVVKPASISGLIGELRQCAHLLAPSDGSSERR